VAIDAVGLAQLRLAGANARISKGSLWELPMMRRARALGLGAGSGEQLQLIGLDAVTEGRLRGALS
jgi:hypothetical protein